MKEEAINQLIEYLNKSAGFVEEQAPLVVNEILNYDWYFYSAVIVIQILISLLCGLVALVTLDKKTLELANKHCNDAVVIRIVVGICNLSICVCLWPAILVNNFSLFKMFVAPRLYLIERLSDLIK